MISINISIKSTKSPIEHLFNLQQRIMIGTNEICNLRHIEDEEFSQRQMIIEPASKGINIQCTSDIFDFIVY